MAIKTAEQAKAGVQADAVRRALVWIEREIPTTLECIVFWVDEGKLTNDDIMDEVSDIYEDTEEKVQHKIRLVVEATRRKHDAG